MEEREAETQGMTHSEGDRSTRERKIAPDTAKGRKNQRDRDTEQAGDRETETDRHRDRYRETEREIKRETEMQRRDRNREMGRQGFLGCQVWGRGGGVQL